MARQEEGSGDRGVTISFSIAEVHRATKCPNDFVTEGRILLAGSGPLPGKDVLRKGVEQGLEALDKKLQEALKCGEAICTDGDCTYDSALQGDLATREFDLKGHLHGVARKRWTATQDVAAGCFCVKEL